MNENIRVFVRDEPLFGNKSVYVSKFDGLNSYVLNNNVWVKLSEGEDVKTPTLRLNNEVFQQMIDSLSEQIKPTSQIEVDAELKATKYHLEDMRKLAFRKK